MCRGICEPMRADVLHLQPCCQVLRRQQEWKAASKLSPLTDVSWRKAIYSCASALRPLPCRVLQRLVLSLLLFIMCRRAVGKVTRSRGLRYHQSVDGNQLICLFSADAISAMTQMSPNLQEISPQIKISWLKLNETRKRCCWKEEGELDLVKAVGESYFLFGQMLCSLQSRCRPRCPWVPYGLRSAYIFPRLLRCNFLW